MLIPEPSGFSILFAQLLVPKCSSFEDLVLPWDSIPAPLPAQVPSTASIYQMCPLRVRIRQQVNGKI